jgi:Effector-associated domain 10
MPTHDGLTAILDRIASDTYTTDDLNWLGQAARVRGDKNVVQLGRYNVRLERGNNVHIGDRIYRGVEADAIRSVLQDVVQDPGQIGRGSLRAFSGLVITVGAVIALAGMAMFFSGLISAMGSTGVSTGPPPVLLRGFAIAFVGVVVGVVGQLIRGWERPRRR